MSYSFTNADGEPIMSGEAYRFEQQLDADYQAELDWQPGDDYDDDVCPNCGEDCEGDCPDQEPDVSLMDEYEGPFGLWGGMDE